MPQMTLIDYKGFRVIAVSVLPIGKTTLVYGSADSGHHIFANPDTVNLMKSVSSSIQLLTTKEKNSGRGGSQPCPSFGWTCSIEL